MFCDHYCRNSYAQRNNLIQRVICKYNLRHSTHTQNSDRKSRSRSHNLRHSTHTQNSERKSKSRSHNLRHITLKIPIGKPQPMIHKCEIQLTTPTGKNLYIMSTNNHTVCFPAISFIVSTASICTVANIHLYSTIVFCYMYFNWQCEGDFVSDIYKPQNMIRAWMKFDSLLRSKTISIYFYQVFVFLFLLYADLTYILMLSLIKFQVD
jgi:hypothetical protein